MKVMQDWLQCPKCKKTEIEHSYSERKLDLIECQMCGFTQSPEKWSVEWYEDRVQEANAIIQRTINKNNY